MLSTQKTKAYILYAVGEILLVVIGILIALQIDNWNDHQKELQREVSYLQRLEENLSTDLQILKLNLEFYSQVFDYGQVALQYADGIQPRDISDWEVLVSFFHASQIWPVFATSSTYEELKSSGELSLIQSTRLRNDLAFYYGGGQSRYEQTIGINPPYRKKARGMIPYDIQNYLWDNCHVTEGDLQILSSCEPGAGPEQVNGVLQKLIADEVLMEELSYYMSSIKVGKQTLYEQRKLCAELLDEINKVLH